MRTRRRWHDHRPRIHHQILPRAIPDRKTRPAPLRATQHRCHSHHRSLMPGPALPRQPHENHLLRLNTPARIHTPGQPMASRPNTTHKRTHDTITPTDARHMETAPRLHTATHRLHGRHHKRHRHRHHPIHADTRLVHQPPRQRRHTLPSDHRHILPAHTAAPPLRHSHQHLPRRHTPHHTHKAQRMATPAAVIRGRPRPRTSHHGRPTPTRAEALSTP